MQLLRSLLFMIIFYLGSFVCSFLAFVGGLVSTPLMRWAVRNWALYHRWCARWFLGIHVRVEGELADYPVFYALKHESMFEAIDLPGFFHLPVAVAKVELSRIPFWGGAAKSYGMIFADREGGAKALRTMLDLAKTLVIGEGRPLVIFPEGTRVKHGEKPPLQSGFAALYKLVGLPVVPIAIDSGRLSPRGSFIKKSGTITYRIGEEIPAGLPRAEIEARVHDAINALND